MNCSSIWYSSLLNNIYWFESLNLCIKVKRAWSIRDTAAKNVENQQNSEFGPIWLGRLTIINYYNDWTTIIRINTHITAHQIFINELVTRRWPNIKNTYDPHHDNKPIVMRLFQLISMIRQTNIFPWRLNSLIHRTWALVTFPISTNINSRQRRTFCGTWKYLNVYDRSTEGYSSIRVSEMPQTMETSPPAMCVFPRQLHIWRR